MENGGATRNRTEDILLAKQTLYQLSYGPEWNDGRLMNLANIFSPLAISDSLLTPWEFFQIPVKERINTNFKNLLYVINRFYHQVFLASV